MHPQRYYSMEILWFSENTFLYTYQLCVYLIALYFEKENLSVHPIKVIKMFNTSMVHPDKLLTGLISLMLARQTDPLLSFYCAATNRLSTPDNLPIYRFGCSCILSNKSITGSKRRQLCTGIPGTSY